MTNRLEENDRKKGLEIVKTNHINGLIASNRGLPREKKNITDPAKIVISKRIINQRLIINLCTKYHRIVK